MKNIKEFLKTSSLYLGLFALSMIGANKINATFENRIIAEFRKTQQALCLGVKSEIESKFKGIANSLEVLAKSKEASKVLNQDVLELVKNDELYESLKDSKYIENDWNDELLKHIKIHDGFVDGFYLINPKGVCLARMNRRTGRVGADFIDRPSVFKIINENYDSLLVAEKVYSIKEKVSSITLTYPHIKNNKLELITRAIIHTDLLSDRFLKKYEGYNFSIVNLDDLIVADTHLSDINKKYSVGYLSHSSHNSIHDVLSEELNYGGAKLRINMSPDLTEFNLRLNNYQSLIYSIFGLISLVGIGANEIHRAKKATERELVVQNRIKEELKLSEQKFKGMLELSPGGIFQSDKNMKPIYVNQECLSMFGYTLDEIKQIDGFNLLIPEDRERAKSVVLRRFKGKKIGAQEYTGLRKNKTMFPVLLDSITMPKDGKFDGLMGIVMDITEKKKLEQKQIQSQRMDSIGNLAAGIAHDFNNMLTAIKGNASLLLMTENDEKKKKSIEAIMIASSRSEDLIKSLLGYAREGQHKIESVNLNGIVREVYSILERTIVNKKISLELKMDKNLYSIDADATQIHQVVLNLCVNADHAISNAGVIEISTSNVVIDNLSDLEFLNLKSGNYVKLIVKDSGCGIPENIIDRVFDPFFTTKNKDNSKGTGLGLATSYGIIQNHKGSIYVDSKIDVGTSFIVYLPKGSINKKRDNTLIRNIEIGYGRILVVDDEPSVHDVSRMMLDKLGYTVLSAADGLECIDIYRKEYETIDIVLLDMLMPKMGGKEAFIEMKKINPHVKVILSTGYDNQETIQEMHTLGITSLLKKPYSIKQLSYEIAQIVR